MQSTLIPARAINVPQLELSAATLTWREALPYSTRYADGYFGHTDVVGESEHVFLKGNDLPNAWMGADQFVIGELGFGAGLNFAVTRNAWLETRRATQRLHYVSVEAQPFSRHDMARLAKRFGRVGRGYQGLAERWPTLTGGFHRISWPQQGVFLTLLFGSAAEVLPQLEAQVDAWYLDGFAPSRNPSAWSNRVMAQVARLSSCRATAATYSAAGHVRNALRANQFVTGKCPGFGAKREMTKARRDDAQSVSNTGKSQLPMWARSIASRPRAVNIVGAGIAGASVSYALRQRGVDVTVFDIAGRPAPRASGVGTALVGPRLPAGQSVEGHVALSSWCYAQSLYAYLGVECSDGLLRLDDDAARLRAIAKAWPLDCIDAGLVSAGTASNIAGVNVQSNGIWWRGGGVINSLDAVKALLDDNPIQAADVKELTGDGSVTLLTNALGALTLAPAAELELRARSGQVSHLTANRVSKGLRTPIAYGGYITPPVNGLHDVGASYDHIEKEAWLATPLLRDDAHRRNAQRLRECVPSLAPLSAKPPVGGWIDVRAVTPDHLPMAGPVYRSAQIRPDHRSASSHQQLAEPLCWGLLGLGSYGFTAAPLLGELIAAKLFGEPWPLPRALALAVHPSRFRVRALRRAGD